MELPYIAEMQHKDKTLMKQVMKDKSKYEESRIEKTDVFTYQGKIYVPPSLFPQVIAWYHQYLCHPVVNRTELSIRQTMYWPGLTEDVKKHVKTCLPCQKCKNTRKPYAHLPAKASEIALANSSSGPSRTLDSEHTQWQKATLSLYSYRSSYWMV